MNKEFGMLLNLDLLKKLKCKFRKWVFKDGNLPIISHVKTPLYKQNSIYIPCIPAPFNCQNLVKKEGYKVHILFFDVLSLGVLSWGVVCKDEFGDTNPTFI